MKNALRKDFIREIRKNTGRFLSIFFIVMLGSAFFAGVRSAGPDMKITEDDFFKRSKMMDIRIISTLGITDNDLRQIRKIDGVAKVAGGFTQEVIVNEKDRQFVLKLIAATKGINELILTEGRLPEKKGEVVADAALDGYEIGDTLRVSSGTEDALSESINREEFTIVGFGNLPYYLDTSRGSGSIGNGKVEAFAVALPEVFCLDAYTEAYLLVDGAGEYNSYSDEYKVLVDRVSDEIEGIKGELNERRYNEVVAEAEEKIADAETEIADGEKELSDARAELDDAKQELHDAWDELTDAKKELEKGEKELRDGRKELSDARKELDVAERELLDAKAELDRGGEQLSSSRQEIDKGRAELEATRSRLDLAKTELAGTEKQLSEGAASLAAAKKSLEENRRELDARQAELDAARAGGMELPEGVEAQLAEGEARYAAGLAAYESQERTYQAGVAAYEAGKAEYEAGKVQFEEGEKAFTAGLAQYEEALAKYNAGKSEYEAGRAQYDSGRTKYENGMKELEEAEQEYAEGWTKYEDGLAEYKEGLAEYLDGEAEYQEAYAEHMPEIEDAKRDVAQAKEDLRKLKKPKLYALDHDKIASVAGLAQDAERMDSLGNVFPVIFFLVAALVSLTAMTRMVDEQRLQIGTLKALGYSSGAISWKYLKYALIPSVLGGAIGVLAGERIIPKIIVDAYQILYTGLDRTLTPFHLGQGALAVIVATACTCFAAWAACASKLREKPASLMRPDAPKSGKRVLLENIPPIWKRMSFTQKATTRNLFRYKKRFFMTVAGIAACMGLIIVGFGLYDSITAVAKRQYKEIFLQEATLSVDTAASDAEIRSLQETVRKTEGIDEALALAEIAATLYAGDAERTAMLYIPERAENIGHFLRFQDRVSKKPYSYPTDGVGLSEKTAAMLGVKVGDIIEIEEDDEGERVSARVSVIVENYVGHYCFLTDETYRSLFHTAPEYNEIMVRYEETSKENESRLGSALIAQKACTSIQFTTERQKVIDDMLKTLTLVTWILLISAGLLAFVVLYNLNNINITERKRELATLKVLGSHDGEVAMYVYRENLVLTILGIALGCLVGKILHLFTILTVEVDLMMFGRHVSAPSYLKSALITILFTVIVNTFMFYSIRKINMIESLKSVE